MDSKINHGWLKTVFKLSLLIQIIIFLHNGSTKAEPQRRTQTFRIGDAIRLSIWQPWAVRDYRDDRNQSLNLDGDYIIDNRGYVFIPLIGDVKVLGHNTQTLAEVLKEKLSQYSQDPIVVVEPLIRVAMLGEFRRPGTYLIRPDASLWELVDLAGGPKEESNLKKMWVERGGRKIKTNLLGSFERAYSIAEIGIQSGDQVSVPPKRHIRFRDAFDILSFGVTLLNLYIVARRL